MKDKEKVRAILQGQYESLGKMRLSMGDYLTHISRIESEANKYGIPMLRIRQVERIWKQGIEFGLIKE